MAKSGNQELVLYFCLEVMKEYFEFFRDKKKKMERLENQEALAEVGIEHLGCHAC